MTFLLFFSFPVSAEVYCSDQTKSRKYHVHVIGNLISPLIDRSLVCRLGKVILTTASSTSPGAMCRPRMVFGDVELMVSFHLRLRRLGGVRRLLQELGFESRWYTLSQIGKLYLWC